MAKLSGPHALDGKNGLNICSGVGIRKHKKGGQVQSIDIDVLIGKGTDHSTDDQEVESLFTVHSPIVAVHGMFFEVEMQRNVIVPADQMYTGLLLQRAIIIQLLEDIADMHASGEHGYFLAGENPIFRNNDNLKLEKDGTIRFKVIGVRWMEIEKEFRMLGSLDGDYLGPI
ncbi:DNA-directed RNA polymerase V subunit 7 [Nymphaea thermarum]|nr:DNA-directed RNA polymerase V subunit 7 [Nymphaea thermarum]